MEDKIRLLMILVPALPLVAAVLVAVLGPRVLKAQSHWLVVLALIASFGGSVALLVNVRTAAGIRTRCIDLDVGQRVRCLSAS